MQPEKTLFDCDHYDVSVVSPSQYNEVVVEVFGAAGTVFFLTDELRTGDRVVELVNDDHAVRHRIRLNVLQELLARAAESLKRIDQAEQ